MQSKINIGLNKIYNMDCIEGLKALPDNCIDMVITSPPYYNLRDYGTVGEIGQESTVDEYINKLLTVFNEIRRVLKDSGSCWVNIDDVYSKQTLLCIPDRFKQKMVENGWLCRNEIIWHKPNAMPSSAKSRFNNDYEKLYFFTKKTKYYFQTQYEPFKSVVPQKRKSAVTAVNSKYQSTDQETSVRQGMNKKRGEKLVILRKNLPNQEDFVEFMRSRTTIDDIAENSHIKRSKIEHWFRRDKSGFAYPSVEDWNNIKWLVDDWSDTFKKIDEQLNDITIETDDILKNADKGRIKRAIWSINTKPFKGCHYAPYPEELIETPILACCPEQGIVVDPFIGSGTTAVVATKNNRNYIGFELSKEYCEIAEQRIAERSN
jgi:site-specific DNA-methyltransferase (adenine-specific)